MKYEVNKQDGYTVLSLKDKNLNAVNAPDLKSEFVIMANEGVPNLILDMADVEFVDSSGLSAILTANRLWTSAGGSFVLTGIEHAPVKKLIEISRLESVIDIIPNLEKAASHVMMNQLEAELRGDEEE